MEAIGIVLVVLSLPLVLRWIPPNHIYGFRIPATLRNRSLWYDVNARFGRHALMLGLVLVALEFVLPPPLRIPVLRAIALIGIAAIIVIDWRTANRWARERPAEPEDRIRVVP
jgi:uncharacterized membrane protein